MFVTPQSREINRAIEELNGNSAVGSQAKQQILSFAGSLTFDEGTKLDFGSFHDHYIELLMRQER